MKWKMKKSLLEHFIKHKPLISEEWVQKLTIFYTEILMRKIDLPTVFYMINPTFEVKMYVKRNFLATKIFSLYFSSNPKWGDVGYFFSFGQVNWNPCKSVFLIFQQDKRSSWFDVNPITEKDIQFHGTKCLILRILLSNHLFSWKHCELFFY